MNLLLTRRHGRLLARVAIATCLILACIALTRKVQAAYLDHQVNTMTAELKNLKMKTMCAGRFLIDVPADAEVSYRGAMIAGWSIATFDDETDEQFAARVEKKEVQLGAEKNERGMPSLESTHQVDQNGVHGKIHVFGREWIRGLPNKALSESVRVEAMIRVKKHSFNLTRELGNDGYLKKLSQLTTQFRAREANEIPTEEGFCFDGGFITEPITVTQTERTTMFVGLNGHPDVSIVLDMTAGITTRKTFFERYDRNIAGDEYRSRFHTFRRGTRTLNGQAGDELLERVHELNGNYGHSFMWEAVHNKTDSVFTPDMSFEMSTGIGQPGTTVDASLTDAHALALWDKMLSSLRVRPVVPAKPVIVVPTQVPLPLGTLARANERCPATGWWECAEGNEGNEGTAIASGRRQYYREGEGMAQAVQLARTTPWQRLTGQQSGVTSTMPTSWKLVSRRQSPRVAPAAALMQPALISNDDGTGAAARELDAQFDASTAPGTMADSGTACPASGWWRCADALALDGTRWFGRGQSLPMATVRQDRSLLGRLQVASDITRQRAAWIFVRHDDGAKAVPERSAKDDSAEKPA